MKVDKSLQEVWSWKDQVYRNKNLSMKETIENIVEGQRNFLRNTTSILKPFIC